MRAHSAPAPEFPWCPETCPDPNELHSAECQRRQTEAEEVAREMECEPGSFTLGDYEQSLISLGHGRSL